MLKFSKHWLLRMKGEGSPVETHQCWWLLMAVAMGRGRRKRKDASDLRYKSLTLLA